MWNLGIFHLPEHHREPKGYRIKFIIEAVQLRPATIMFVDDNPMNLNEPKHYVPDLQVADETFVLEMLNSPLFKGKDDSKLSRLTQYKLLERRKADEVGLAQHIQQRMIEIRAEQTRGKTALPRGRASRRTHAGARQVTTPHSTESHPDWAGMAEQAVPAQSYFE